MDPHGPVRPGGGGGSTSSKIETQTHSTRLKMLFDVNEYCVSISVSGYLMSEEASLYISLKIDRL